MSVQVNDKYIGHATAYGYAKAKGYTGTEQEFAALMASYASVAEEAAESAEEAAASAQTATTKAGEASASATAAATAKTAAQTAQSGAETAAQTATTQAGNASDSATTASAKATEAAGSAATASTKATEAATSATNAAGSATTASTKAGEAAASATAAAASAEAAEEAAQTLVIDTTLTQAGQAADAKKVGDEISTVKDGLNINSEAIEAVISGGSYDNRIVPNIVIGVAINALSGAEVQTSAYNATSAVAVPNGSTTVSVTASFSESLGATFYDASGSHIENSGVCGTNAAQYGGSNTSVPQTLTFPVPQNATTLMACIRTTYYTKPSDVGIVFHATIESAYGYTDRKTEALAVSTDQRIKEIADTYTGKNLVDEGDGVIGAIQSNGSVSTSGSYANYTTSNYIPVSAGITYFLGVYGASGNYNPNGRKMCLLYDAGKTTISSTFQNITTDCTFTPTQDGYVRVSWATEGKVMLEVGSTHTEYEAYYNDFLLNDTFPLTSVMEGQIGNIANNILASKKWAHCGDSFSHYTNAQFSSGTFSGKDKTFPRLIAERNGMTLLQDFMLSGRTLAYPSDGTFTNALTAPNQTYNYQNIPSDVDYVTIMLGINDCQHVGSGSTEDGEDATGVITLGTIDDATIATYYGAWNVVLGWLRENRPFAHVGIVVTNGTTRQDYTEAQIAIAKKWGYPYINLNGDERTPAFIRAYNPNLPQTLKDSLLTIQGVDAPTNTHPNWQTHELESTIIEEWLRTL